MHRAFTRLALAVLGLLAAQAGTAAVPVVKLNDTGSVLCRDADGLDSSACAGTGQDGETGRDTTLDVPADGRHGFSFVRVCNNGVLGGRTACAADAPLGSGLKEWGCTKDLRTGLIWEVKTTSGLRAANLLYTNWGDGRSGDASELVAAVNAVGLCGGKNWRLPSRQELQGLVDYGVPYPGPAIDLDWFPNTFSAGYHWTADARAEAPATGAWGVGFQAGHSSFHGRESRAAVRLVRGTKGL